MALNLDIFNYLLSTTVSQLTSSKTLNQSQIYEKFSQSLKLQKKAQSAQNKYKSVDKNHPKSKKIGKDAIYFLTNDSSKIVENIVIKLELSNIKAKGMYLKNKNIKQLLNEKSKVKKELIFYDQKFKKIVGRYPVEVEKEHMKRCYLYYNNLKKYIEHYKKGNKVVNRGNIDEIEEINKKLFELIGKKETLRKFLLNYKEKFIMEFGRTLSKQKDYNPILKEFTEYQNLKKKIKVLGTKMKDLEKNI